MGGSALCIASGGRAAGAPAVAVARQRCHPHGRARQPARQVALNDQVAHQRVRARLQRRRQQAEHLRCSGRLSPTTMCAPAPSAAASKLSTYGTTRAPQPRAIRVQ